MTDTGGFGPNDIAAPGPTTVDTPDPYGTADASSYAPGDGTGVDVPVDFLPPWPLTRAPGTQATIAAGEIVPLDPWEPVVALLDDTQLALLNRESAARQSVMMWADSPRDF